jgi:hypothetical protein
MSRSRTWLASAHFGRRYQKHVYLAVATDLRHDVRCGSLADIEARPSDVRPSPESGHCGARLVCPPVPIASIGTVNRCVAMCHSRPRRTDIQTACYSIASPARRSIDVGINEAKRFAVSRLIARADSGLVCRQRISREFRMQATASVSCGQRLTERLALGLDPRRTCSIDRSRHSARGHDRICVF